MFIICTSGGTKKRHDKLGGDCGLELDHWSFNVEASTVGGWGVGVGGGHCISFVHCSHWSSSCSPPSRVLCLLRASGDPTFHFRESPETVVGLR